MSQESQIKLVQKVLRIDAPVALVWQALIQPKLICRRMLDSELGVSSEWKEGSALVFRGFLHDQAFEIKGMIERLETEKIFSYTNLNSLSDLEDIPDNYSLTTFELTAAKNHTLLAFTQSNFPGEAAYEHSRFYWNTALFMLKNLVESGF